MRTTVELRLVMLALALQGCSGGGMSWQTIITAGAPGSFAARGDEVWGSREQPVMRRAKDGTWKSFDLCTPWTQVGVNTTDTAIAFEGAELIWAMCGNDGQRGQRLVRHDGKGNAQRMPLPVDGVLQFVPLLEGPPALLGQHALWVFEGGGWVSRGEHPALNAAEAVALGSAAGRNASEVYLSMQTGLHWFNGTTWAPVSGIEFAEGTARPVPQLRFGKVLLGASSLSGGAYVPMTLASQASLDARQLRAVSLVTPDTAFIVNASLTEYFWAKAGDAEPTAWTVAPVPGQGGATPDIVLYDAFGNAYDKKGYMENSSGVVSVFPVNLDTLLVAWTGGVGLSGGQFRVKLIEGKR